MEINLLSTNANVGNRAAGCNKFPAKFESGRNAYLLDGSTLDIWLVARFAPQLGSAADIDDDLLPFESGAVEVLREEPFI
jgi:hypothetical protein